MSILVNKPQFDMEVLKPGNAVEITKLSTKFKINTVKFDALLGRVTPLVIQVWYYDTDAQNTIQLKQVQIHADQIGVDYEINRLTYYTK